MVKIPGHTIFFSYLLASKVIVSSEVSGQLWNTCIWDLESGGSLQTYKGGSSAARTLCMIQHDYLISAVANKSAINVWALRSQDQVLMKMTTPGNVRSMAVSPCGQFCVAAIMDKIHIWQVCTGELIAATVGHYQNINIVRFTRDGSYVVSGGDDGLVILWSVPGMLTGDTHKGVVYSWNHHSLPVTDIYVGHGHGTARILSSSLDHTCKMYDLVSGSILCSFIFNTGMTSVTMDHAEMRMFAGSTNGDVYVVNLFNQPLTREHHVIGTEAADSIPTYRGHTKQVTCLSVSLDGNRLVSGSHDWTVKVWDVSSCQCVRTIHHKGAITNAFITIAPRSILDHSQVHPTQPLQAFKRFLIQPPSNMTTVHSKVEPANVFLSGCDEPQYNDRHVGGGRAGHGTDLAADINGQPGENGESGILSKDEHRDNIYMKRIIEANTLLYRQALDRVLSAKSP